MAATTIHGCMTDRFDHLDPGQAAFRTHEVENMAPPLVGYNLFGVDAALGEAAAREGASWALPELSAFGDRLGREETIELGFLANRHVPVLHTHDRTGRRRDEVEYHPAWHALLGMSLAQGLHASPWSDPRPGAHVARASAFYLAAQIEAGILCPTTMTHAAVPALRRQPDVAAIWEPRVASRRYDPRFRPAEEKTGALIGMGMTEKQGGSDLRSNATRATPVASGSREYRLVGHKWFFSAPMSDAFLVTAQAPGGLSCFLLPRWTPDGALNGVRLQRLKDKLGNRANASSEVEFQNAWAVLLGEEGRGVPTIMEMVNHTRLDCAVGSAGLMRQALTQALFHAARRRAFERRLVEQPLMASVLADLALEAEAAMALGLRLARAYDAAPAPSGAGDAEAVWRRVMTPAIKYFVAKRAPGFVGEALEVFGGIGFIEESILPRLYREAPLNSVWEGSGNVMCLDVRRALRVPGAADALLAELAAARGGDARLDRFVAALEPKLRASGEAEARALVERLVLAAAASLLVRFAPPAVADAFCASRLDGAWTGAYGTLPSETDAAAIVRRASGALA
ncbi:MAG TPA: isovaleryl-CoA dehydrogenase [Polyangiaceae bacterium]|nr:isovaleryl-CoA dehydrogenase [Polyangiaceae bacterium]